MPLAHCLNSPYPWLSPELKIIFNHFDNGNFFFLLRGSSDRYKSLWELTRDIALRALELAACQTAHWKKSSKLRDKYKDRGRHGWREGEVLGSEGTSRSQTGRVSTLPSCISSSSSSSSSHCPLITVQDTRGVQSPLIKQQQIAETQET